MKTDRTSEKLKLFRIAINHQADEDIAVINKDALAKRAKAKKAGKTASNDELRYLREERERVEAAMRKDISKCSYDMKKAVLRHRNQLIEDFFKQLESRLHQFVQSDSYTDYLRNCLEKIKCSISLDEDTVIYARPADVELVRSLTSCEVVSDNGIAIGGLCARCKERNRYIDVSLDNALATEKAAFTAKAELRL